MSRPLGSVSLEYIKVEDLLKLVSTDECIPVGTKWLRDRKGYLNKKSPPQIIELDLTKHEE